MGSALAVPAADAGNDVTLVGSPLDDSIIDSVTQTRIHPGLKAELPDSVTALHVSGLTADHINNADLVVIGVSSPGINWIIELLLTLNTKLPRLAIVTKGLVERGTDIPQSYAHLLPEELARQGIAPEAFIAIGGPCIAREIVFRQPTSVVYASDNRQALNDVHAWMQTPDYRVHRSDDVVGVEVCAALKNFYAIGVSAMLSGREMPGVTPVTMAKNPLAALFNQAVREMAVLCHWMQGDADTAYDLAGMGDLHVTVGGGRNSRLGKLLGEGLSCGEALSGPLAGETVEGVDTGKAIYNSFTAAVENGRLSAAKLPVTAALLDAIHHDKPFAFDFQLLG